MEFLITGIVIPILYFIYNTLCYFNKKVIYAIQSEGFSIMNNEFFKVQFIITSISCVMISLVSYLWHMFNLGYGAMLYLCVLWTGNYLIKFIAVRNKYAEEKKN